MNIKISNLDHKKSHLLKQISENKISLSHDKNQLIKLNSNLQIIQPILNEILDISELFFDYKMPFLSSLQNIEQFSINHAIYIIFILKYPSNYKIQRLEKMKDILLVDQIEIKNFPFEILFKYDVFNLQTILRKNSVYSCLFNEFATIKLLLNFEDIDLLIIDPMHFLEEFLNLEGRNIIVEEFTTNENTEKNVVNALEKGNILLVKNFDQNLKIIIDKLSERRNEKIIRHYIKNMVFADLNEEIEPKDEILIFNNKIQVHPKFKLIVVLNNEKSFISQDLSANVIIFYDFYLILLKVHNDFVGHSRKKKLGRYCF